MMKNLLAGLGCATLVCVVASASCVAGIAIGSVAGGGLRGDGSTGAARDSVAVITVSGAIAAGESSASPLSDDQGVHSDTINRYLRRAEADPRVKAVVLRVDSPGGAVTPSDEIRNQVLKLKAQKPVVVSVGSLAASGGYYISAPASVIMANDTSLTGSIGVIVTVPNVQGLMEKLGVEVAVLKSGAEKDATSGLRPLTDADRAILQGVVDETYDRFVRVVAEGRSLPVDKVRALADGRIYTARQAKALGLIDEFGDLPEAIRRAGELGGIGGDPAVVRYQRGGGWLRALTGGASQVLGLPKLPAIAGITGGQTGFSVQYLYLP